MSLTLLRTPINWVLAFAMTAVGVLAAVLPAQASAPSSGQLIRGQSFTAVYYMGADGFRYVFPNDKTYFTWYENFDAVVWISDEDLGKIQIGGNVTYKPGVKMVKIQSDPKTYAIEEHGTLRHVASESIATSLYGSTWNTKIDDIPDGFFSNYTIGDPIAAASDYSVSGSTSAASSINVDKGLEAYKTMIIEDSRFHGVLSISDTLTISAGGTVRFTNSGTEPHTATADDSSWGTGTIQPDEAYIVRFNDVGTYDFYDSYDRTMTGTIVVE